jgi:hypothetical protein
VKRINDYLKRLASGQSKADFLRDLPDLLLVEIEGTEGGNQDVAVTAKLTTGTVRSQSLATREARVFPLGGDDGVTLPTKIGRAHTCGITVDHPSVSKEHAVAERGPGGLLLEDLGSTNGTFVNAQRLVTGTKTAVRPDDAVRFGRASMYHLLNPDGFHAYLDLLQRFGL